MTLFDDEYVLEAYAKEREDNAALREAKNTATRMIMDREPLEKIICYVLTLSMDEIKKFEIEVMQLA